MDLVSSQCPAQGVLLLALHLNQAEMSLRKVTLLAGVRLQEHSL